MKQVDKLTGPVIGRPKSATFRTIDVVGLDTLVHTANGVKDNCPNDEMRHEFEIPEFVNQMMENKWLGSKTKQGFYKKEINSNGKKEILCLDLNTLKYRSKNRVNFKTLELTKSVANVGDRFEILINGGRLSRKVLQKMFFGVICLCSK